jgi:manganese/zinc/iron transport system substrate-binding protein
MLFAGCDSSAGTGGSTDGPMSRISVGSAAADGPDLVRVSSTFNGKHPIDVVCTTGMVADVVRNVGGKQVEVSHLMGAGVDPHLYKASPGDVGKLSAADVIFYSGLHLEGKMGDVFVRMARSKPVFAVTEYLDESLILETADGAYDPHVWFDVAAWSKTVGVVRDVLVQFDPPHAKDYQQNAEEYRAELEELDAYAKTQLATIPEEQRVLVTAHDAFRYFGRAYGIEVRGIQGISTESEAGVREINELVRFIADRKIKAVFVETSVSERNIQALVEGSHAHGHDVEMGGELYSDAMGEDGSPEGTYVGMVRHNVDTITSALK